MLARWSARLEADRWQSVFALFHLWRNYRRRLNRRKNRYDLVPWRRLLRYGFLRWRYELRRAQRLRCLLAAFLRWRYVVRLG